MSDSRHSSRAGFTIMEMSVASILLIVAVTMGLVGLVYVLRSVHQNQVQNELDNDVQIAMENIKVDVRLTTLKTMFFYPPNDATYVAMSMARANDDDGDGALEVDADGHMIWDETVIYHRWTGEPAQLRRTVFSPRLTTMTDAQRILQLRSVVTEGHGRNAANGNNAKTEVLFQNLFDWSITPRGAIYDGYAAQLRRDKEVVLGSVVLKTGANQVKFDPIGKNSSASEDGYRIGLDTLIASPSYVRREAERLLPAYAYVEVAPVDRENLGGSWSGNRYLVQAGDDLHEGFTVEVYNDMIDDATFSSDQAEFEGTTVLYDDTLSPAETVVTLEGAGESWTAGNQTAAGTGTVMPTDFATGTIMRVVLRGKEMISGGWLFLEGAQCRVTFRASALGGLRINAAYIAEAADDFTPGPDVNVSSAHQFTFGGNSGVLIPASGTAASDYAALNIDEDKSYVVAYQVGSGAGEGNPFVWPELDDPTMRSSYMVSQASGIAVTNATWPSNDYHTAVIGVDTLETTFPAAGYYISPIHDTRLDAPSIAETTWSTDVPSGAQVLMRFRSGASNDMSDATGWTNVTPGAVTGVAKRYLQYAAELRPDPTYLRAPILKSVQVKWPGPTTFVDIGGTIAQGPDFGIFEVEVNGQRPKSGVYVELDIYQDTLGFVGEKRMRSGLATEITPRNSAKD